MKIRVWLSGLLVAFLGLGIVHGQEPSRSSGNEVLPAPTPERNSPPANNSSGYAGNGSANALNGQGGGDAANGATNGGTPDLNVSSWIAYPRCNCCGPLGGDGPISAELYARTGVSFPFGPGILNEHTSPGIKVAGGVRTLLFNPTVDAAWTIDLGASTAWYGPAGLPTVQIRNPNSAGSPDTHPLVPVTPKSVNQSFLELALGRELYLWGTGACGCDAAGPTWRVGWDAGARWGTGRVSLQPNTTFIRPRTGTLGGFTVALHSDLEVPHGCCVLFVGLRTEYGWGFGDLLGARNDTDLQTVNVMLNFGFRY
jgi:hypothetical protein